MQQYWKAGTIKCVSFITTWHDEKIVKYSRRHRIIQLLLYVGRNDHTWLFNRTRRNPTQYTPSWWIRIKFSLSRHNEPKGPLVLWFTLNLKCSHPNKAFDLKITNEVHNKKGYSRKLHVCMYVFCSLIWNNQAIGSVYKLLNYCACLNLNGDTK